MSSKKGKKLKGKTYHLTEFRASVAETPETGKAVVVATKKYSSWADEADDIHSSDGPDTYKTETFVLPTAPRSAMGPDIDPSKIPTKPPYTAFIANLPYDVETSDIERFFKQFAVQNIRLPREGEKGRLKGFGYVEFADAQSLLEAISLNDSTIKSRKIRVDLAGTEGEQGNRDNSRRSQYNDRDDRTSGDWRSAPREGFADREESRSDRFGSRDMDRGGDRDGYDRGGYRGGSRFSDRGFSDRDRGFDRDDDRGRNFRNFDRGGGRYDSNNDRDGRGESFTNRGSRSDYNDRGSRYEPPRERSRRYEDSDRNGGPPRRTERFDDGGGRSMRSDPDREYDAAPEASRERKKLVLLPKTALPGEEKTGPAAPVQSIFGGAKPVDTTAREREIERRLAKEREEKEGSWDSSHKDENRGRGTRSSVDEGSWRPRTESRNYVEKDSNKENRPHSSNDEHAEKKELLSRKLSGGRRSDEEGIRGGATPSRPKIKLNRPRHKSDRSDRSSDLDDGATEKLPKPVQYKESKPPSYESENKFAGLSLDDNEIEAGSGNEDQ